MLLTSVRLPDKIAEADTERKITQGFVGDPIYEEEKRSSITLNDKKLVVQKKWLQGGASADYRLACLRAMMITIAQMKKQELSVLNFDPGDVSATDPIRFSSRWSPEKIKERKEKLAEEIQKLEDGQYVEEPTREKSGSTWKDTKTTRSRRNQKVIAAENQKKFLLVKRQHHLGKPVKRFFCFKDCNLHVFKSDKDDATKPSIYDLGRSKGFLEVAASYSGKDVFAEGYQARVRITSSERPHGALYLYPDKTDNEAAKTCRSWIKVCDLAKHIRGEKAKDTLAKVIHAVAAPSVVKGWEAMFKYAKVKEMGQRKLLTKKTASNDIVSAQKKAYEDECYVAYVRRKDAKGDEPRGDWCWLERSGVIDSSVYTKHYEDLDTSKFPNYPTEEKKDEDDGPTRKDTGLNIGDFKRAFFHEEEAAKDQGTPMRVQFAGDWESKKELAKRMVTFFGMGAGLSTFDVVSDYGSTYSYFSSDLDFYGAVSVVLLLASPTACWMFLKSNGLATNAELFGHILPIHMWHYAARSVRTGKAALEQSMMSLCETSLEAFPGSLLALNICLCGFIDKQAVMFEYNGYTFTKFTMMKITFCSGIFTAANNLTKFDFYGEHVSNICRFLRFLSRLSEVTLRLTSLAYFSMLLRPEHASVHENKAFWLPCMVAWQCFTNYVFIENLAPTVKLRPLWTVVFMAGRPPWFMHAFDKLKKPLMQVRLFEVFIMVLLVIKFGDNFHERFFEDRFINSLFLWSIPMLIFSFWAFDWQHAREQVALKESMGIVVKTTPDAPTLGSYSLMASSDDKGEPLLNSVTQADSRDSDAGPDLEAGKAELTPEEKEAEEAQKLAEEEMAKTQALAEAAAEAAEQAAECSGALIEAVKGSDIPMIDVFAPLTDLNGFYDGKEKALFIALDMMKGSTVVVEKLLEYRADINSKNHQDVTALQYYLKAKTAAEEKGDNDEKLACKQKISLLLSLNADPSKQDSNGENAFHFAIRNGEPDAYREFLTGCGRSALRQKGKEGVSPLQAMSEAAELADTTKASLWVDVLKKEKEHDEEQAVADEDTNDKMDAAQTKMVVEHAANLQNPSLMHILYTALLHDSASVAQFMFKHHVPFNVQDDGGATPLHVAALKGSAGLVDTLLELKADATTKDKHGSTALHFAVYCKAKDGNGNDKGIEIVNKNQITDGCINVLDSNGVAPLHLAVLKGSIPLCKLLFERGAAIENLTTNNFAAVHMAASVANLANRSAMWELLMKRHPPLLQYHKDAAKLTCVLDAQPDDAERKDKELFPDEHEQKKLYECSWDEFMGIPPELTEEEAEKKKAEDEAAAAAEEKRRTDAGEEAPAALTEEEQKVKDDAMIAERTAKARQDFIQKLANQRIFSNLDESDWEARATVHDTDGAEMDMASLKDKEQEIAKEKFPLKIILKEFRDTDVPVKARVYDYTPIPVNPPAAGTFIEEESRWFHKSLCLEVWSTSLLSSEGLFLGEAWLPSLSELWTEPRDYLLMLQPAGAVSGRESRPKEKKTMATDEEAKEITGYVRVTLAFPYPAYELADDKPDEDGMRTLKLINPGHLRAGAKTERKVPEASALAMLRTGRLELTIREGRKLRMKGDDKYPNPHANLFMYDDKEKTWSKSICKTEPITEERNPQFDQYQYIRPRHDQKDMAQQQSEGAQGAAGGGSAEEQKKDWPFIFDILNETD